MQAAQGPVHLAGPVQEDGTQLCSRCQTELAGPLTMVPPADKELGGITFEEAEAMEPQSFPEGAYVLEASEDTGAGVMEVHLEELDEADMAMGAYLMCGESGWEAEIARQDAE
jgi:hypothetical protein